METYVLPDRLCKNIAEKRKYRVREEPGVKTPSATLGSGSCRVIQNGYRLYLAALSDPVSHR